MRRLQRPELGLRARVTLAFAGGAFVLSAALSGVSYGLVRNYLVDQTQTSAFREAFVNAGVARDGLRASAGNVGAIPRILASLQDSEGSPSLVFHDDNWFPSKVGIARESLPQGIRQAVNSGRASRQTYRLEGSTVLAVGLPLPGVEASYFELFSLDQLDRTLRFLGIVLLGAGLATTVAGAAVGRWASARVLRPVSEVAAAAAAVAGGRLETRLPDIEDADLAALTSSFNSMADALQARIERDARFASDVSHELRSPLTTLATTVQVLASRRDELPERSRAALDLLTADVERFQRLVEDLLEISRYDAGVADLHLEDVRLTELVTRAVQSVGGPAVELGPGAVADGLAVQADKRRMTQVIKNLVENAARYGGGATRVIVDAGHHVARVAVDDEGPGVAPDERDAIFERFFRGSASGQRRGGGQGSGLGLSLVTEHVRLHGGRVWVEDNPVGKGARFIVEFPLSHDRQESA
ncbi:MAG TPA: HAMP domain-containing sensor histidine kinase [Acidimicrobiia bacterium]|nr:HAMP domain-containing sensor histidine kinase [Acidimicrobiia bacterium]